MKNSIFDMLIDLLEKSFKIKKSSCNEQRNDEKTLLPTHLAEANNINGLTFVVKPLKNNAKRIFIPNEFNKLTLTSYRFLLNFMKLEIIAPEIMELIINQLLLSESRFVGIQETKWIIRNILADSLNDSQLAFLDLVLYHQEEEIQLH